MRRWVVLALFLLALGTLRVVACGDFDSEEGCEPPGYCPSCEGVVCAPDENKCTFEECNCGTCHSYAVDDGTHCRYDGLSGVCLRAVCREDPCEGMVCDDDDACTHDRCWLGTCDFTPFDCWDNDPCTEAACDPVDGCIFTAIECCHPGCWVPQDSGTENDLRGVSFTDANNGTAVGDSGTILRTTDGGATWVRQDSGISGHFYGVSFTDADNGTIVGSGGTVLRTASGEGGGWPAAALE